MDPLEFTHPMMKETVRLKSAALAEMLRYRQNRKADTEAGGQIFARFSGSFVEIERVTGPHPEDKRSRFFFRPSRKRERQEIQELHNQGLHFVGDWHTHPQPQPNPSGEDLDSIKDIFAKSRHELKFFFMIILGTDDPPCGIWFSIHDQTSWHRMELIVSPEEEHCKDGNRTS